jgi:hypothetical protein
VVFRGYGDNIAKAKGMRKGGFPAEGRSSLEMLSSIGVLSCARESLREPSMGLTALDTLTLNMLD